MDGATHERRYGHGFPSGAGRRQGLRSRRDISDCDGHVAADIRANVYRVAAAHPIIVDVAEEVQRALSGAVPDGYRVAQFF